MTELRLVEIELFSYCNRKCDWCPNKIYDRSNFDEALDEKILEKLLFELKEMDYEEPITFSRFNEPLSKPELFAERIKLIKSILPDNKLISNTNGDYFSGRFLKDIPLDELTIMDYDNRGMSFGEMKLKAFNCSIISKRYPYIFARRNNMKILYHANWSITKNITDRGGVLKEYSKTVRTEPCLEPKYFIGINYDGTVSPCCNIRNDIPELQPYIMGDLNKQSLKEILESEKYLNFQNKCESGIFEEGSPCYYCENKGGRYTQGKRSIFYE